MDVFRCDVEHPLTSCAGGAAGLLDEKRHRVGLVELPQRARVSGVTGVARIEEHAAAGQDSMRLGDKRCDPSHVEVFSPGPSAAGLTFADIALHRRLPESLIARVDSEFRCSGGYPDILTGQDEFAHRAIKRERVHAGADTQHQHRRRAVDGIPGTDLFGAWLEIVRRLRIGSRVRSAKDRKDAARRRIHVDVRRALKRVERQKVLPLRILRRHVVRLGHLRGDHSGDLAAPLGGTQEALVGSHVRHTERCTELAHGHPVGDRLARQRHVENQPIEIA